MRFLLVFFIGERETLFSRFAYFESETSSPTPEPKDTREAEEVLMST
jgi:hypothetical protein